MFHKSELEPLGYIKVETLNPKNKQCFPTEYTVVTAGFTALLGSESVQQFGIMSLLQTGSTQPDLVSEFQDLFSGVGKLEGKLHLEIDKSVPRVVLPVRKVPFAVKDSLKQEIERLVQKKHLATGRCPNKLDFLNGSC